jgi:hypothetical protein
MTRDNIFALIPPGEDAYECFEGECLVEIGRNVGAEYAVQGTVSQFGGSFTLTVEAYETMSGKLLTSFTAESPDAGGLLAAIREDAPALFFKVQGKELPTSAGVAGGIILQSGGQVTNETYTVKVVTNPAGASLMLDRTVYASQCPSTPCAFSLRGGEHQLIASKEFYASAIANFRLVGDTTIQLALELNAGILNLAPQFVDGMGKDKPWQATVGGRPMQMGSWYLAPNNYQVKLTHPCYQDILFEARINNGETYTFTQVPVPRMGGVNLDPTLDGYTSQEPVWINGFQVGNTPFTKTIPICATIEVGATRFPVPVKLVEGQTVTVASKFMEEKVAKEAARARLRQDSLMFAAMDAKMRANQEQLDMKQKEESKKFFRHSLVVSPKWVGLPTPDIFEGYRSDTVSTNVGTSFGVEGKYSFFFIKSLALDLAGSWLWATEADEGDGLGYALLQTYSAGIFWAFPSNVRSLHGLGVGTNYSQFSYRDDCIHWGRAHNLNIRKDKASGLGWYANYSVRGRTASNPSFVGGFTLGYAWHNMSFPDTPTHRARNMVVHEIYIQLDLGFAFWRSE